ncbi:glycogen synthase GlgA [Sporomusa acidovorans]|uniref:Glycogen synthase n=1 Tax=Sporomusa acidovorans (strain ATCC 49682 / DSM 3132 / Mol) TaxID=1123286 RepID=A0ABZ3J9H3_SPOA4|nr:glycogen synthase GlgA [Sporomusa acidovorans]OZC19715.1 glycogen synthase [Sporomusa acidovorans DSM 3132]SDF81938.1 starch synthase [Sporomusa acidovorans]
MLKVLFVASEAAPFAKTGGMGDVIAALPKELRRQGVDARVIIPKYGSMPEEWKSKLSTEAIFQVSLGWRLQYCGIEKLNHDGVPFYFVDNEYYFKRSGLYGHFDDAERFVFFCRAVLEALPYLDFQPHILHCHDWHSGMISVFLTAHYRNHPFYKKIRTLFTIHNLKYQGIFPKDIMLNLLNLGWEYFKIDGIEFYDKINFMKGGLIFSDLINTVSPTYAQETQHAYYGEKLEGVLTSRRNVFSGIINGIDYTTYNPATDPNLFINYDRQTKKRKIKNKITLQKMLGLSPTAQIPLIAMNTRLVEAKGLDLVIRVLDEVLSDAQIIIVGQGDEHYHHLLWQAAWLRNGQLAAIIPYNEDIARKLFAAADMFLMPSRYEPCGIGQLIAMRYGAVPIVRETGGLKDTVQPYNEFTGEGNGFSFTNYNAHDLLFTIRRAIGLYHNRKLWSKLVDHVMAIDNSWRTSTSKYMQLYNQLYVEEYIYKKAASELQVIPDYSDQGSLFNDFEQLIPIEEAPYAH